MFQVQSLIVLLGISLCIVPLRQATAQQFSEIGVVYEAARNKIGLMNYCRSNNLLDPIIAEQVITAVEIGLREISSGETFDTEQGDRAQQAGEDGFWEAGRKRDIASVAALFRTTPAELCKEWAGETLRAQAPKPYREVRTFTVRPLQPAQPRAKATLDAVEPIDSASIEEVPIEGVQVQLEPVEVSPLDAASIELEPLEETPIEEDADPAVANAVAKADAQPSAIPPLPVKAPFQMTPASSAKLVAWQRAFQAGDPASSSKPVSANITGAIALPPTEVPQPSKQETPLPETAPLASDAAIPIPSQPVAKTAASRARYAPSHPLLEKRPAGRVGKLEQRCLMPGCRWR